MTQELTIIENPTTITVFDSNKVDDLLKAVREEALSLVADVSTAKGRAELKSQAYKVSQWKTHMLNLGKDSIADKEAIIKAVKTELKKLSEGADEIRDETKRPAIEWEEKEEARKQAIMAKISDAKSYLENVSKPSAVIKMSIDELKESVKDFNFEEYIDEAKHTINDVYAKLNDAFAETVKREAEQDELEKLREEKEKRDAEDAKRAEEEATRKAEEERKEAELKAAQVAKAKAERDAKEAAEREEQRKIDELARIEQAKADAIKAERQRAEREQAENEAKAKAEAQRKADEERKQREIEEAKAANEKHRAKVRKASVEAIRDLALIDLDSSVIIVRLIEEGKIPSVSIKF